MKKLKKYYKWIVIALIAIIIAVLCVLIYVNLFKQGISSRLDGIEEHELTKKEIDLVKESFNKLDEIKDIEIFTNSKIIKIFLELEENIEFKDVNEASIEAINNFSTKNLKFYDIEIFIDCLDEEQENCPMIGYKHKSNSDFTWNR